MGSDCMQDLLTREISLLRKDIPKIANIQEEYIFSLVCYKYFYNNGCLSYSDYKDVFVDGRNDGGIDLVTTIDDSNYQTSLVLIQSKYISQLKNSQDIIDIFNKMSQTYDNFMESRTAKYNRRLKQKLKDKLSLIELQSNIELTLFINVDISEDLKVKINETLEHIENLNKYTETSHIKIAL